MAEPKMQAFNRNHEIELNVWERVVAGHVYLKLWVLSAWEMCHDRLSFACLITRDKKTSPAGLLFFPLVGGSATLDSIVF
jgi:hypothetical protein